MSVTNQHGQTRSEIDRLLTDTDRTESLVTDVLGTDITTSSRLSESDLRDIATTYLTSVLPAGTDREATDFAQRCVSEGLREETLTALLTECQRVLFETIERDEAVSPRVVLTLTGRDISRITAAFVRASETSGGEDISETIGTVHSQAENVTDRSTEIAFLTDQQSSNMDELSREVGDVSAAVEEIAASADEVNAQSDDAARLAEDGCVRARDLSERIDTIHTRATRVNEAVAVLEEHVADIDEFVDSIDEIADQTNMLALNASIEAARVDGSEGFAVVADEVKSLAEDSQDEAARIRKLVTTVDEATTRVTEDIQGVYEETEAGREEADRAVQTFESIEEISTQLSTSMDDVAVATDQQAESTEELAMMADEASRKASMILEEITEISDSNQALLETLESSLNHGSNN